MGASLFRLGDIRKIALFQEAYSEREEALFDYLKGGESDKRIRRPKPLLAECGGECADSPPGEVASVVGRSIQRECFLQIGRTPFLYDDAVERCKMRIEWRLNLPLKMKFAGSFGGFLSVKKVVASVKNASVLPHSSTTPPNDAQSFPPIWTLICICLFDQLVNWRGNGYADKSKAEVEWKAMGYYDHAHLPVFLRTRIWSNLADFGAYAGLVRHHFG